MINRRDLMRLGAMAGLGAAVNNLNNMEAEAENISGSGADSEYDKYDALGLAALIAERRSARRNCWMQCAVASSQSTQK
ncbi:MAG: hypothetical protein IPL01_24940 [Acidobacteria bacterium]|nr:hypothetical protein [Acidobacteriota bacterium]